MFTTSVRIGAVLAASALGLAACSSSSAGTAKPKLNSDTTSLAFAACGADCSGTIEGAAYKIEMPTTWNGTLLLWSHGYRNAFPTPPDNAPVETAAEDGPSAGAITTLLGQGYAVAGSGYASNGWAVQDGIKAGEQLQALFVSKIAKPRRTYVWGASLGGLITELISEKHPEWVTGAAPECGAVAGTTENLDGALGIAFMVKTLLDPTLQITSFATQAEAGVAFAKASKAVIAAAQDVAGGGTAKVVAIATLARLASQTLTYDGHDAVSGISAKVEAILRGMGFATFGQQEFSTRVGGDGLDISDLDLSAAATDADRSTVKTYGGNLDTYLAALKAAPRPAVEEAARAKAIAEGETTGKVSHPTVTLHDEQDPLVIPQNERVLGDRFFASGDSANLTQLFTKPPATYAAPAPYGAGHCNFTDGEQVALVAALDDWVRTGVRATPQSAAKLFTAPTGYDVEYQPPAFPFLQKK
jgi:pimeloyl-ACP methyl ester carboxylesterase